MSSPLINSSASTCASIAPSSSSGPPTSLPTSPASPMTAPPWSDALRRLRPQHLSRLLTTRRGVRSRRRALVRDHGLREATGSQQLNPSKSRSSSETLLVLLRFTPFADSDSSSSRARARLCTRNRRGLSTVSVFLVLARVDRHDAASVKMTTGNGRNCPKVASCGGANSRVCFTMYERKSKFCWIRYVVRRCDACSVALYAHLAALRYWRYCSRDGSSIFFCRGRYSLSSLHFGTGQLSSIHCLGDLQQCPRFAAERATTGRLNLTRERG